MKRSFVATLVSSLAVGLVACGAPAVPESPVADTQPLEGLSVDHASATLTSRAEVASDALQADIRTFSNDVLIVESERAPRTSFPGRLSGQSLPQDLAVGDVLISEPTPEAPRGIFVRVVGVDRVGDSLKYDVVPASFEDAFEELRLSMVKELSASELASATGPQGLGGSSSLNTQATLFDIDASFDDYVICDGDGKKETTDDQIKVTGAFKANLKTFADIDINWRLKLKHVEMGVEASESLDLSVKGKCGDSFDEEWHIKTYTFKPFTIWVGPVPLVFTPYVGLYIGANGEVYLKVDVKAEQSLSGRFGVQYDRGEGWRGIKETESISPKVAVNTVEGRAEARAYIGAKAGVFLYSVAEGHGFPKAFVDAEASITALPERKVDYCVSAGVSLSVGASLDLNLIVTKIKKDWEKDLGDIYVKEIVCKQEPYTGSVDDILPSGPSGTYTLTVEKYGRGTVTVSSPGVTRRCSTDCVVELERGARVNLSTGNPNTIWWGGCAAGMRSSCSLTMSGDTTVHAEFAGPPGGPLY